MTDFLVDGFYIVDSFALDVGDISPVAVSWKDINRIFGIAGGVLGYIFVGQSLIADVDNPADGKIVVVINLIMILKQTVADMLSALHNQNTFTIRCTLNQRSYLFCIQYNVCQVVSITI